MLMFTVFFEEHCNVNVMIVLSSAKEVHPKESIADQCNFIPPTQGDTLKPVLYIRICRSFLVSAAH